MGGGVPPKFFWILFLGICCSPNYLVIRMDSILSQLSTVAEIEPPEVGPCAQFFTKMYEKISKKLANFCINGRKSENLPGQFLWNLVKMFVWGPYKQYMLEFWKFWYFGWLRRAECSKLAINGIFNLSRGTTSQKIKFFKIPAYTFCRALRWTTWPSFIRIGPVDSQIFVRLCENYLIFWRFFHTFSRKKCA